MDCRLVWGLFLPPNHTTHQPMTSAPLFIPQPHQAFGLCRRGSALSHATLAENQKATLDLGSVPFMSQSLFEAAAWLSRPLRPGLIQEAERDTSSQIVVFNDITRFVVLKETRIESFYELYRGPW